MMEVLTILSIVSKALPFLIQVAELIYTGSTGQGTAKRELVLGLVSSLVASYGGKQDVANWELIKDHVGVMIDESVTIMNILATKR